MVREAHGGGLTGHFGLNETIGFLKEYFYWPKMGEDIYKIIIAYFICYKAKSQFHQGLYTQLSFPLGPWDDVSIDFIMSFLRTQRGKDAIVVVMDIFYKIAHFIPCHKTDDVSYIAEIYFRELIRLDGVPKSNVSDQESKFLFHLWRSL